ncbi:hypothetical protein VDGE_30772 [Verticillium dahliae]|uniref:Uncharacterized protein n=1 Tax=Verticillium dahliae TaxID=27337 RepID=A0A444S088_VERDA|nr:hypothetical protein VDGE_30772 [Verticillium dahliae]
MIRQLPVARSELNPATYTGIQLRAREPSSATLSARSNAEQLTFVSCFYPHALNPSKTPLHSRSILLLTISYAPTARGRIAVATSFEPVLYCARRLFYPTSSRHSLARPSGALCYKKPIAADALESVPAYRAQSTATPKPWSGVWQQSACWFTVVAITFVSWARPSREPRPDPVPLLSSLSGLARQVRSTSGTVQYALERPF